MHSGCRPAITAGGHVWAPIQVLPHKQCAEGERHSALEYGIEARELPQDLVRDSERVA
ncbi:hypothetical protein C0993_006099, partial [Termitomyces sp. T159_Od127]